MKRFAGLILLLAVIVVVAVVALMKNRGGGGRVAGSGNAVTLKGFVGGEKVNLLKDPAVIRILKDRYNITLDFSRRGSLEMVQDPAAPNQDFLWPSSQVALEMYRDDNGRIAASETIFNSPIILCSWATVTDALIKQGIVEKTGETYYIVDFGKLLKLISAGRPWKEIGVPQLYGNVTIFSTDPTLSNSGNMFAGLLANMLNNGQVVNDAALPTVMSTVKKFFDNQGFMEQSSDAIFTQFLNRGMGDKPLIVGYEAQLLEYSVEHPDELTKRTEKIRMLYPKPTVWSSHPLIAVSDGAKRLIPALQDTEIQRIAWQQHGFRGASGVVAGSQKFAVGGIPATIDNVIPMPSGHIMKRIFQSLGGK